MKQPSCFRPSGRFITIWQCYCAQLDAAKEHLGNSYEVGNAQQIKFMALDDDDLKPLWEGAELKAEGK